jgi:hypothetical protein
MMPPEEHMKAYIFLAACQLVSYAWAQPAGSGAKDQIPSALSVKPAQELFVVDANGGIRKAPKPMALQLQTEVLSKPASVGDLLRRNGLSEDPKTIDMLKRLNPAEDFSSGLLPVGAKIAMFAPKSDARINQLGATYLTFDSSAVASLAVRDQVTKAAKIEQMAYKLPSGSFQSDDDMRVHRDAVMNINRTVTVLQANADSLAGADFAIAQYQIDYAIRTASSLNDKALKYIKVPAEEVQTVRLAAAPLQEMALRISSRQTPLPLRRVKVSLYKQGSTENINGMQVYVLPAGVVDHPEHFSSNEVLNFLTRFSFADETSPSVQDVPLFDARIWVGPKLKYKEMAAMVKLGKLKKFMAINDPSVHAGTMEVVFRSPGDLIDPK